jgi:hypothetical protein
VEEEVEFATTGTRDAAFTCYYGKSHGQSHLAVVTQPRGRDKGAFKVAQSAWRYIQCKNNHSGTRQTEAKI